MEGAKGVTMSELDAIGEVVTGGMLGRAVEPKAGEVGADGHTHEANCLNCGTALQGDFCHVCGQHAHIHRTLTAFFHDLLHGVLHFEGKTWRTLPMLAWQPGELTRRYIEGERARFVSPMALFLFSVFLMYAAVSLLGDAGSLPVDAKQELQAELQDRQRDLAKLEARRDAAQKAGEPVAKWDERVGETKDEIATIEGLSGGNRDAVNVNTKLPGWIGSSVNNASRNPELVAYKLKTNAYKFSWLIIPLSVPFVWFLFPLRRRYRLYDHTVFVTYSLCFMGLLAVTGLIVGAAGFNTLSSLLWLIPPLHMYRQLKGAYALGRGGALWRTAALTIFALMVMGLFSAIMVGMGTFD